MSYNTHYYDEDADNIYYNVEIFNSPDNNKEIDIDFFETRDKSIISGNLDQYFLSVVRFNIPNTSIPITFLKPVVVGATDLIYRVTLSFGGSDYTTNLIYTPRGAGLDDYKLYRYQHFLDMINTALQTSYNNMIIANGGFGGVLDLSLVDPPIMLYDVNTGIISIRVRNTYIVNNVDLFFDFQLFNFFETFENNFFGYNLPSGKDIQILIKDNNNNTDPTDPNYLLMSQEYQSLSLWYSIRKIIITTNHIPVEKEYISSSDSSGNDIFLPILTDFTPQINGFTDTLTSFNYFPSGPYRLTDLNGSGELRKIDFKIFWEDKDRILYPVKLQPSETFNMKILFMRKTELNIYNAS